MQEIIGDCLLFMLGVIIGILVFVTVEHFQQGKQNAWQYFCLDFIKEGNTQLGLIHFNGGIVNGVQTDNCPTSASIYKIEKVTN